jgi:hypothetical protein
MNLISCARHGLIITHWYGHNFNVIDDGFGVQRRYVMTEFDWLLRRWSALSSERQMVVLKYIGESSEQEFRIAAELLLEARRVGAELEAQEVTIVHERVARRERGGVT